ncbi:glutathione-dependent formaldehyde-activating enzyme [Xylaria sp. CBS 124048]|nr:glutathione-dependent formaldehyde-activating enzyme [Xylaria sp. CBS 124048]
MAENEATLKTYRGNCHCAAYVYEITLPEIESASECNCSVCYKKATIWVFPEPSNVKFVKGDESTLTRYNFNQGNFTHSFCSTCGVSLKVSGHLRAPKPGEVKEPDNGFNVRTLQHGQIDLQKIKIKPFNGQALPPSYQAPVFTGLQPAGEVKGGQLYTGSCHCGAVTVGLKSKPIDKDTQGLVECNCSICGRYGATWAYPNRNEVAIDGRHNLTPYAFNKKAAGKLFCKKCGVPVAVEIRQFTDEEIEQMDEATKEWYVGGRHLMPINLRIINGLNVKELAPSQCDGYSMIGPAYVEP